MAPVKVAVIGGGPSGMFFCHAMHRQNALRGLNPQDRVQVTCFEQSDMPGGVWKALSNCHPLTSRKDDEPPPHWNEDDSSTQVTPSMYAALWTNGPSHNIEFGDYTFDQHFKAQAVPVYMRRKDVLEYMKQRVLHNHPTFFQDYFQFGKRVTNVKYMQDDAQFHITVQDKSGHQTVQLFDKCVWACGDNGKKFVPKTLLQHFENFQGVTLHSTETSNLREHVEDKQILLIGGGYSAEDLALQTIKLGVKKVFIVTRDKEAPVNWTTHWPFHKVKLIQQQQVRKVYGNTIEFEYAEWTWPGGYTTAKNKVSKTIHNIDTVIFCTGYLSNMDMLEPALQTKLPGDYFSSNRFPLQVPDDWKMKDHPVNQLTGTVIPGETIHYPGLCVPTLYRGILIDNPNMMFVSPYDLETPLLALDVYAWLLASFVSGTKELPSADEMKRRNHEQALREMSIPYVRYYMDSNYCEALDDLSDFWDSDDESESSSSNSSSDDSPGEALPSGATTYAECAGEYYSYLYDVLYEAIQEGGYPLSRDALHKMAWYDDKSYEHRRDAFSDKKKPWQTFRDCEDSDIFQSVFTGSKARPLEGRWLDIE